MIDERFEESKKTGKPHHLLHQMVGEWVGDTRTWFEPEVLTDESETRCTIRQILEGRFIQYDYEGTLTGQPMNGTMLLGYDLSGEEYQAAWIDNLHMGTGMMHLTGSGLPNGFSVRGSYAIPGHPRWGWRTVFEMLDPDHLTITAYNITPEGEEAKGIETIYRRTG